MPRASTTMTNGYENFRVPLDISPSEASDPAQVWEALEQGLNALLKFAENEMLHSPQDQINHVMYLRHMVYVVVARSTTDKNSPDPSLVSVERSASSKMHLLIESFVDSILLKYIDNHILPTITTTPTQPATCMSVVSSYVACWRRFVVAVMNMKIVFSPLAISSKYLYGGCQYRMLAEFRAISQWQTRVLDDNVKSLLTQQVKLGFEQLRQDYCAETACLLQELKDALLMLHTDCIYADIIEKTYIKTLALLSQPDFTAQGQHEDLPAYALHVLHYTRTELERSKPFLKSTELLSEYIVHELVDKQMEYMLTPSFDVLFLSPENDKDELQKLRHIYRMIALSKTTGMATMQKRLTDIIEAETRKHLLATASSTNMDSHGHIKVILVLMGLINRFIDKINNAFDEDKSLMRSMEVAMIQVFSSLDSYNVNRITLAKQLAYTQHRLLSKETSTAVEGIADRFGMQIHDAISISYFLTLLDPDAGEVFVQAHRQYMAIRLLTASYDAAKENLSLDQMMFTRYNPTLVLCRAMLNDAVANRTYIGALHHRIPTVVRVVDKYTWAAEANDSVALPTELKQDIAAALNISKKSRPYRRIHLAPAFSTGTVILKRQGDAAGTRVVLLLSLVQLCIALLFNQTRTWRVCNLMDTLNITLPICRASLEPFIRAGVFSASHADATSSDAALTSDTVISISDLSAIAAPQLSLVPSMTSQTLMDMDRLRDVTDKQNKSSLDFRAIDAQIVRLVKSQSAVSYSDIMKELNEGPACWLVSHALCKDSLERLCERGYLVRAASSGMYRFVS